jgi:hypothetical protein
MNCNDPYVKLLRQRGYNPVLLPRTSLTPLGLLVKERGGMRWVGNLASVFASDTAPVPSLTKDQPVADLKGERTGWLSARIGLGLLGDALSALGVNGADTELEFGRSKRVQFTIEDVLQDHISEIDLDAFLADSDITTTEHLSTLLAADDICVIVSALKARRLTVTLGGTHSANATGSIPIAGPIGPEASVGTGLADKVAISYEGQDSVVFAVRAVCLTFSGGRYMSLSQARGSIKGAEMGGQASYLQIDSPFISLPD